MAKGFSSDKEIEFTKDVLVEKVDIKPETDMEPEDAIEEIGQTQNQDDDCVECNPKASSSSDFAVHKVPSHCEDVLCMANFVKCDECNYKFDSTSGMEVHEDQLHEDGYIENLDLKSYRQSFECEDCDYEVHVEGNLKIHEEAPHEGIIALNDLLNLKQ